MKCKQCGAEIADDSIFCPECGARCEGERNNGSYSQMIFCPNCGQSLEAGSVFCPNCGQPIEGGTGKKGLDKKKLITMGVLAAGAAVILIAAVGVGRMILGAVFSGGGDEVYNKTRLLYVKDDSIYYADLKKLKKDPVEYTDELRDGTVTSFSGLISASQKAVLTKDGKYCFYPERIDEMGTFRLMRIKTGNDKDSEKVDSNVYSYTVLDSGNVVYQKDNGSLYIWDGEEKTKLESDAAFYQVSEDDSSILWYTYGDDGKYDLYYKKLNKKDEGVRIESNIIGDCRGNKDFSRLYFKKNDDFYMIKNQKDKVKLADDIYAVFGLDTEKGTFYFTKILDQERPAWDFVIDDIGAGENTYYWDRLRNDLSVWTILWDGKELYYFNGEKEELIAEQVYDIPAFCRDGVIFTKDEDEEDPQIRLSQISYARDVEDFLRERREKADICLASKTKVSQLDMDYLSYFQTDEDNGLIYALEGDSEEEEKTLLSINCKKEGDIKTVDEDVEKVEGIFNGSIYYFKDMDRDLYSGDLCCDGETLLSDVAYGSVTEVPDSSMVVCIVDGDEDDHIGTLVSLKNGKDKKIADDVYCFDIMGEKSIVMLSDYDMDRQNGDLMYFQGKKTSLIDSDVIGFYPKGNEGQCP